MTKEGQGIGERVYINNVDEGGSPSRLGVKSYARGYMYMQRIATSGLPAQHRWGTGTLIRSFHL